MDKNKSERITKMKEIVGAIDHWLKNFKTVPVEVGAIIQRHAMRELAFIEYLGDDWIALDELRVKANDELQRLGELRIPIPIYAPVITKEMVRDMVDKKQKELTESLFNVPFVIPAPLRYAPKGDSKLFDWKMIPFPTINIAPKKTRREELEAMNDVAIEGLYRKVQKVDQKKARIRYILEAEKEYK